MRVRRGSRGAWSARVRFALGVAVAPALCAGGSFDNFRHRVKFTVDRWRPSLCCLRSQEDHAPSLHVVVANGDNSPVMDLFHV